MKVKCDFCDRTASGNTDTLIDKGWARAIFTTPVRRTITSCGDHIEEAELEINKVMGI
jgi:hypothetical protein